MPDHEAHPKGLAEGSVVCGDFTLIRLLRRAPLTSVWLACAAGDDEPRHVARVVHVRRPDGANRVERLRHAFDVLRELRHPAIPEVLAASVEGEEPVLVTPRIEGRTLRAIIWRQPRPQLSVVSRVVRVVASAIDALHAQEPRVVHRVVCPENIVVDVNGHVWLEECGVAHALVAAGWLPEAVSPNLAAYLSPDELKHVVHPRTDIFALATVAFEWLTGRVPFSGESEADRAVAILVGSRPSVSAYRADLTADLDDVFARAWNVDDTRRATDPHTAGAFADDIERERRAWAVAANDPELPASAEGYRRARSGDSGSNPAALVELSPDTESENPTLRLRALTQRTGRPPPPLPSAQQTNPGSAPPPEPVASPTLETQPLDTPPNETQAVETQPVETQPVETQPVETQPVETQPVETQPVEAQPVETQPVETQPVETQPVETQPVEAQPVEAQPVEAQPVETHPLGTRPVESTRPAVTRATPSQPPGAGGRVSIVSKVPTLRPGVLSADPPPAATATVYDSPMSRDEPTAPPSTRPASLPPAVRPTPSEGPRAVSTPAPAVVTQPPSATSSQGVEPAQMAVAAQIAKYLSVAIVLAAIISAGSQMYVAHLAHESASRTLVTPAPSVATQPAPEATPAQPEATPAQPEATPAQPEATPTQPETAPATVDAAVVAPSVAATPSIAPDASAPALPATPRAADAQRMQLRLAPLVVRCVAGSDVGATVRLLVTYARSGRATRVVIPGPANEEPMGACLESAVFRLPLPPFSSPVWQTTWTFAVPTRR